eukprot:gnl/TRDRNA2_/TRDRNA2_135931_c0_seq1.p2 gnl/TRDRNA2_/TRDRNA2_135931_c0~~gnl/TRDRNA2_/TRDRNA2_135931_c0_seq1.p2  ORF type:complete len:212 (-),score=39.83 gnl/TRDRNA2_/TRDRNA2_135931_c0_seq1:399-1034(-)
MDEATKKAPVDEAIQGEMQEVITLMQSHPNIVHSLLQQAQKLIKKADNRLQVRVRQLSGEIVCVLELNRSDTVQAVKRKIQEISRTDINEQVLVFGSTEIRSGTMNTNNIQNGCELNLIVRKEMKEPKRPPSAYFLFVMEKRQTLPPGGKLGDVARRLTDMWQQLSPDEKRIVEDRARALKVQWEKDMEAYKEYIASQPVEEKGSKRRRAH